MHTIIIFSMGLILLIGFLTLGKKLDKVNTAMKSYALLWFVICVINMNVGIVKAGYTFLQELPIFLVLFGVLALLAVFLAKQDKRHSM